MIIQVGSQVEYQLQFRLQSRQLFAVFVLLVSPPRRRLSVVHHVMMRSEVFV